MIAEHEFAYRRPRKGRGMVREEDARFLHQLIVETRPRVAVEIGVASGCSSVHLLDAMATYQHQVAMDGTWLHSFDVAERCYFDPSKPTGFAVAELTPWHLPRFRFTVGDVLLARERLAGLRAPFAFIDANHFHPWAAADLLGLLPALAPEAWVALHDIRLPLLSRHDSRGHGPRYLFDTWPGEKRQGGSEDNIGAIRLPRDLGGIPDLLRRVFARAWEVELPAAVCAGLDITPRPVASASKRRAMRLLTRAAGQSRPIYVCGTGRAARSLAGELRRRDLAVEAFLDRDRPLTGAVLDGLPVMLRRSLSRAKTPRPFLAVSGTFAREIDVDLASSGWVREQDYVVL